MTAGWAWASSTKPHSTSKLHPEVSAARHGRRGFDPRLRRASVLGATDIWLNNVTPWPRRVARSRSRADRSVGGAEIAAGEYQEGSIPAPKAEGCKRSRRRAPRSWLRARRQFHNTDLGYAQPPVRLIIRGLDAARCAAAGRVPGAAAARACPVPARAAVPGVAVVAGNPSGSRQGAPPTAPTWWC
jgi:hypothetical protein